MKARPPLPAGPFLLVGLARSGIAAGRMLRERGETVIGVDAASPAAARALLDAGIEVHTGVDGLEQLGRVRTVVKSPGVPSEAAVIVAARERGMAVLGELELAWRALSNEVLAVTGTNGKTTTVELLGHIHRQAGRAVAVAGNVGTALSSLVGEIAAEATVACEVSSFQLEDASCFAPEAAVLLNIAPDHLDRHGTIERYLAAKLKVFARQSDRDLAVLPAGMLQGGRPPGQARLVRFGADPSAELALEGDLLRWHGEPLLTVAELALPGAHNVQNAMAAAAICLARGLPAQDVAGALRSFEGVAHRLELLGRRDGVTYVNDSKATNVASAVVALEAFPAGTVHVILGGQGKGQDFTALREPVARHCRAAYLIGEDAPALALALAGAELPVRECGDLEGALAAARAAARPGEVVLLSPACASFDQFADFEARGERFRELARR